jgi:hypothetical protein
MTLFIRLAFFAALLALPACVTSKTRVYTRPPECHLAPRTPDSTPRFVLSSRVHYLQKDPRWANDPIGGSGKPLRGVGCAICCLSMALAEFGIARTPAELNRDLKQFHGYNDHGWVYWSAIEPLTLGKARVDWIQNPTHRDIESALVNGQPVLVKVTPPKMLQHWVLLVGREGNEFLMKDPLDPEQKLKPLSSLRSQILAVRIVKSANRSALP